MKIKFSFPISHFPINYHLPLAKTFLFGKRSLVNNLVNGKWPMVNAAGGSC